MIMSFPEFQPESLPTCCVRSTGEKGYDLGIRHQIAGCQVNFRNLQAAENISGLDAKLAKSRGNGGQRSDYPLKWNSLILHGTCLLKTNGSCIRWRSMATSFSVEVLP